MPDAPRIDYFLTVLSPFVYLAGDGLERIAAKHGAQIVYKPCDVAKVFEAVGALPVPKRHPARQAYRLQELARIARRQGVPINLHPAHWPTSPVAASRAIVAAQAAGGDAGAVIRNLARACWAEERDVADPAVVADALRAAGCDPALADAEDAQAILDANTAEALERGVFGVPFYIVGEERFWGQDRLDYLDEHLARRNEA